MFCVSTQVCTYVEVGLSGREWSEEGEKEGIHTHGDGIGGHNFLLTPFTPLESVESCGSYRDVTWTLSGT